MMRSWRNRFAFRLAIALGIPDPLTWIDTVDPYVIDCWIAYDAVEPIPYAWLQTAVMAAETYSVTGMVAANKGVKVPPKAVRDFMPKTSDADRAGIRMTAAQQAAWAAQRVNLR